METAGEIPSFSIYIILLFVFGFATVMAMVTTSFLKIVIVLQLLKSAMGLQEAPPRMAINALAMMLTMYIMAPIAIDAYGSFSKYEINYTDIRDPALIDAAKDASIPFKQFLGKHSDAAEKAFFRKSAEKLWPAKYARTLDDEHLLVLIPAFTVSQLKSAFQAGFMIYLPFIVIDLIISNILLALGMMMVSPIVISMPFKLLLFVLVDGWSRLLHSLIISYQ